MSDTTMFDMRALTEPVPDEAAKAEAEQRFAEEIGRRAGATTTGLAVFKATVLVLGAGVLAALLVLVVQYMTGASRIAISTVVIAALMVVPLAVAQFRGIGQGLGGLRRTWYRLRRFADANGLTHRVREADPERTAAVFAVGGERAATDVVTGQDPRPFEAANYEYETWSGRARMPHAASYVCMASRAGLPAVALISVHAPGALSWAPSAPRIVIGDGFEDRFRVHGAAEDESTVRRLLTPATRAALIDVAGDVDIEIVGRQVFFIARRALPLDAPAYWEWVEDLRGLMDAVLDPRRDASAGTDGAHGADPARTARRAALFRAPAQGRRFLIGCLIPIVFGIVAGVLTATWR